MLTIHHLYFDTKLDYQLYMVTEETCMSRAAWYILFFQCQKFVELNLAKQIRLSIIG